MNFSEAYGPDRFGLSYELFPPKTATGEAALYRHVESLMEFDPSFITCTYGAGGSTRRKTLEVVKEVKSRFHVRGASHLTCVGSTVDQLRDYLRQAREAGVEHIVAIRGDPPRGEKTFRPAVGGLEHGSDLVDLLHAEFPQFGIAVAGYPETHVEAADPETDLRHLKRKVDAGADIVITQLFYNNDDFFSFRDRCERIGIEAPIVPGILPATGLKQLERITSLCGASQPAEFVRRMAEHDEVDWQFQVGVDHTIEQVEGLIDRGVPGLHFYVLNKSQATGSVLAAVGRPTRGILPA